MYDEYIKFNRNNTCILGNKINVIKNYIYYHGELCM